MEKIKKSDLLSELEAIGKGLSKKEILEQSNSFIFKDGKVITYNDEICAIGKSSLDLEGAIEANSLLELLKRIKDENIEVSVEEDELRLKGKKFNTGIKLNPEIRLPIGNIDLDKGFQKLPDNFSKLAKLASLTAGSSTSQSLFTCVHLESDKLESCDNERVSILRLDQDTGFNTLIPAGNLLEIVKEKIVGVSLDDAWIHFLTDKGIILSSRIYNEDYVDLESLMPDEEGELIEFQGEIDQIINRASVFSLDEVSKDKIVHLNVKDGKLIVSARNAEGWYKEEEEINADRSLSFSINVDFLSDMLKTRGSRVSVFEDVLLFQDATSKHLVKLEEEFDF